jgi:hypothetical protein
MAKGAKNMLGAKRLDAVADKGTLVLLKSKIALTTK